MNTPEKQHKSSTSFGITTIGPVLSTKESQYGIFQNNVLDLVMKSEPFGAKHYLPLLLVSRAWQLIIAQRLWFRPVFVDYAHVKKLAETLSQPSPTINYAPFIRRLNLTAFSSSLQDDVLAAFIGCENLERLALPECTNLSSDVLEAILLCYPNLMSLDIKGVVGATDAAIIAIASVAKGLKGLSISGCDQITDSALLAVAENCPILQRVKLGGLPNITDVAVNALIDKCTAIVELDLNGCPQLSDDTIRHAWTVSVHLRELILGRCYHLTDAAFPAPRITGTTRISGEGGEVGSMQPGMPGCNANVVVLHIPKPAIHPYPRDQLRTLDLAECSLLTDDAIEGIISCATKIRDLNLQKCALLTDKAIRSICRLGKSLRVLELSHVNEITDDAVKALVTACNRLRYVDFSCCTKLTDAAVFDIATLPKLRRVGFVRCSNITDEGIDKLKNHNLERIHLSYCSALSVLAIYNFLCRTPNINHLSLTGVPSFHTPELQKFCRAAPSSFTASQRSVFCVYSHKGVDSLKSYLGTLFHDIQPGPPEGTVERKKTRPSVHRGRESDEDSLADSDEDLPIIRG